MNELPERVAGDNGIVATSWKILVCTFLLLYNGCSKEDEEVCTGLNSLSLIDSGLN